MTASYYLRCQLDPPAQAPGRLLVDPALNGMAAWQIKRAFHLVHKPALRLGMLKKAALQVRRGLTNLERYVSVLNLLCVVILHHGWQNECCKKPVSY